jgi:hypothetical protein
MYRFSFCLALAFLVEPNLDAVRTQAQLSEPAPDAWPPQAAIPVAIGLPLFRFSPAAVFVLVTTRPTLGHVATAKTVWPVLTTLTDCSRLLFLASSPTGWQWMSCRGGSGVAALLLRLQFVSVHRRRHRHHRCCCSPAWAQRSRRLTIGASTARLMRTMPTPS